MTDIGQSGGPTAAAAPGSRSSLRGWALVIVMLMPAAGVFWGRATGNNWVIAAGTAVLALEFFAAVWFGRRYRAAHPEQAARFAQIHEAAVARAEAGRRIKLRELGFFVVAILLFFAMPVFLRALFVHAPGLQQMFVHLSLKEQRVAMMLAALALVSAGRLFWHLAKRRPT